MKSRYKVSGTEGQFQPGSDDRVLLNLIGLTDPADMMIAETELLEALYLQIFDNFPSEVTFQTICNWHHTWLGNVYSWAGHYRTVNMSKPDIIFTPAIWIQELAQDFNTKYLSRFHELPEMNDDELVAFLAAVHVEFILIHPFREGNGRISRLLLDVMAVKAGAQPLDYTLWDANRDFYFKSIQAGRDGDYQHAERLVRDILNSQ